MADSSKEKNYRLVKSRCLMLLTMDGFNVHCKITVSPDKRVKHLFPACEPRAPRVREGHTKVSANILSVNSLTL
jgi:hypothetical protein